LVSVDDSFGWASWAKAPGTPKNSSAVNIHAKALNIILFLSFSLAFLFFFSLHKNHLIGDIIFVNVTYVLNGFPAD
jgi:hypothetical protein